MTKIEEIWDGLECNTSNHSGLLYKRYSAEILPDVFIALKVPEKFRCIAFRINSTIHFDNKLWNKINDIKINLIPDVNDNSKNFLLIILLSNQYRDIFSTLCEDLIFSVSEVTADHILVHKLLGRITKWHSLFEKVREQGLSESEQIGLYGEIYFLRFILRNNSNKEYCIKSWLGPEKSIQDFQYSNWAVEVKTTHGNNHQKIYISNERQLDDTIVEKIFLYHLSIDLRNGRGESLNSIINEVSELLNENVLTYNLFKIKLLESGYFETHRSLYEDQGYNIRQENIYHVTANFPRITEKIIPIGVGDVKYSIIITESEEWRINHETLLREIL